MRNLRSFCTILNLALLGMVYSVTVNAQVLVPLPDKPPIPKDNPMTPEKIELGKMLFFDPRLSSTGSVSCNSCHNLIAGGDDSRPISVGIEGKVGVRSAPTVWNAAFH